MRGEPARKRRAMRSRMALLSGSYSLWTVFNVYSLYFVKKSASGGIFNACRTTRARRSIRGGTHGSPSRLI